MSIASDKQIIDDNIANMNKEYRNHIQSLIDTGHSVINNDLNYWTIEIIKNRVISENLLEFIAINSNNNYGRLLSLIFQYQDVNFNFINKYISKDFIPIILKYQKLDSFAIDWINNYKNNSVIVCPCCKHRIQLPYNINDKINTSFECPCCKEVLEIKESKRKIIKSIKFLC